MHCIIFFVPIEQYLFLYSLHNVYIYIYICTRRHTHTHTFLFYFFSHVQMTAQVNTWASHVHVRNFWGINEEQDYDPQCDQTMDNDALQSYIQSCRGEMGWKKDKLEKFRQNNFGNASGIALESRNAGWFCAQRRPGHGLGWLMKMYRNHTNIPDVLMIVDDDTLVVSIILLYVFIFVLNVVVREFELLTPYHVNKDIENLKHSMQQHSEVVENLPFVGTGCVFNFGFAFGGFGTFFNRAAIHQLTQPIYCNEGVSSLREQSNHVESSSFMTSSCNNLQQNVIGELDIFQDGDSALDLFYKYSAIRQFCLHSDWAMGYIISRYLHMNISKLKPQRCKGHMCDLSSITCHNRGPEDMETHVRERSSLFQHF
jgi:hypothetical protein